MDSSKLGEVGGLSVVRSIDSLRFLMSHERGTTPSVGDRVSIQGLEVPAYVGVYEHEQGVLQRLVIDITAECDTRAAGTSDALSDALDYDGMASICREVCRSRHHRLIEAVAEEIALGVRSTYPQQVTAVEVRVEKPGAVPDARTVAVSIRR